MEEDLNTPTAISSEDLMDTPTLRIPPQPTSEAIDLTTIPITDITQQLGQETGTDQQQTDLQQRVLDSLQTLEGRGQAQLQAEQAAGIPQLQQQVQDFNNQIRTLQAEFEAAPIQVEIESEGRGRTIGGAQPLTMSRQRKIAVQALGVSALAQAAQGNLSLAQQQVNREIDVKYAAEEARLRTLSQALEFNRDILERQDKKRTQIANYLVDERSRQIAEMKANDQFIRNAMLAAGEAGAPIEALRALHEETDPSRAAALAGTYISDFARSQLEQKAAQQKFENQINLSKLALSEDRFAFEKSLALEELQLAKDRLTQADEEAQAEQDALKQKDFADVSERLQSQIELKQLVTEYKNLLGRVGFEGKGSKDFGTMRTLRGQITTAIKEAETLGALDAGLLDFVGELIGESPKKTLGFGNFFGRQSGRIVSQLDQQLKIIDQRITTDRAILDTGSFLPNLFPAEDLKETQDLLGQSGFTDLVTSTTPAIFFEE